MTFDVAGETSLIEPSRRDRPARAVARVRAAGRALLLTIAAPVVDGEQVFELTLHGPRGHPTVRYASGDLRAAARRVAGVVRAHEAEGPRASLRGVDAGGRPGSAALASWRFTAARRRGSGGGGPRRHAFRPRFATGDALLEAVTDVLLVSRAAARMPHLSAPASEDGGAVV